MVGNWFSLLYLNLYSSTKRSSYGLIMSLLSVTIINITFPSEFPYSLLLQPNLIPVGVPKTCNNSRPRAYLKQSICPAERLTIRWYNKTETLAENAYGDGASSTCHGLGNPTCPAHTSRWHKSVIPSNAGRQCKGTPYGCADLLRHY